MAEQHPIMPPVDLIRKWNEEAATAPMADQRYIATQAACWGADKELEACCKWLESGPFGFNVAANGVTDKLRAARRPKPPSLKEQALDSWDRLRSEAWCEEIDFDLDFIRRALEQLDD